MERTWLVIVPDQAIGKNIIFHVRNVVTELMARQAVAKEYQRQGWGAIDPHQLDAYRLPRFRGNSNIAQICQVSPPQGTQEPPVSSDMPIVEYV